MTRLATLLALALACLAVVGPARADDLRRATVKNETLDAIPVVGPADEPSAIVVMISDLDGWTPKLQSDADALATQGALVVGVDLKRYLAGLAKETDDCFYMPGDIEEYTRLAGKELGIKTYRFPVLLGSGRGADIVYAMLVQAPPNMFAGGVSIGFSGSAPLTKPLCDGPKTETLANGEFMIGEPDSTDGLQGEWRVLTAGPAPQKIKDFVEPLPNGDVVEAPAGSDLTQAAFDAALDIGGGDPDAVNALPLVLYPPTQPTVKGLVVIYAGDGGWRDLDKTIAGFFQNEGYGVVGVDTLRYFWNEKTPRELGDDLEAILGRYAPEWKAKNVLLAGYSFGADVLPFAWQRLSKQVRDSVRLIALLGLSKTADFEVSVSGWLGVGTGAHDVVKASAGLPMDRVLCVYGKEELEEADNDVACATDVFPKASRIEEPGGHHFDENYDVLAKRLDAEFAKRVAAQPAAAPGR
ncbi:AcvB/VirJ family lysyl-phosphatidylglycerol hydrolase [Methylopila sp. 73B]|uniref:AcvB/VirJ family lysyl-phosphatidylglycerol hydrolase n=1 Tax=Methylopila sp. 73B TaxID=1120792 RepID=UPI000369803A|nr:AcvB/VirJ family lysyl-phosphatidylglycerol hydrolase [Methylopila sp. 73B]